MSEVFRPPALDESLIENGDLMELHARLSRAFGRVSLSDFRSLSGPVPEPVRPPAVHRPTKLVAIATARAEIVILVQEHGIDDRIDPVTRLRSVPLL
ncbi:hypothetical protein UFOVP1382_134 [uncultured Caudovirales phage]|uniref:Uncharacterized protein n=1 Tax=uncultured Caudovirales phage TaxID=2100421 RepID=A0A6J5S3G0_9CAUD|nr:hypothetical protein UFOVP1382_134 [uncultured Caudovirales phage]